MAIMDRAAAHDFSCYLHGAQEEVQAGVVSSRADAASAHWAIWEQFSRRFSVDPTLQGIKDPVPILQAFAYAYRHGHVNPSHLQVRVRTMEDAVCSIGQTFAAVGSPDPRLTPAGKHDFRLRRQFNVYAKVDLPPKRVKPIPLPILHHVMRLANDTTNDALLAIANLICIAFFFSLCPGEYTVAPSKNTPFCLTNVKQIIVSQPIDIFSEPKATILSATFAPLKFTTQKNAVHGKVIGHGKCGSSTFCPDKSLARCVLHLRCYGAPPDTPLASFCAGSQCKPIKPTNISDNL
jgi:hypothetical protein